MRIVVTGLFNGRTIYAHCKYFIKSDLVGNFDLVGIEEP